MDLDIDSSYVDRLSAEHLRILRSIVKRVHMRYYPSELYSDGMADMLISKFGEEYCEMLIKRAIDSGRI